ncbi:MAG: hypothetical protein QXY55_04485 [Candidatus Korarchaeota archaeon]|nr:hypothetical protein [Thermoproteota archaeon]MCR8472099.1 hypothetical protein [Thermoproteota archaeon]MCR8472999.1 hypothetical protein [Thermoproteota archaeon]MCR8488733.1 hypothetical protein [Thermoproteota archaeon]
MRITEDLPNILSLIRSLRKVSDCPKKVDLACLFCLECDKAGYRELEYEDGVVKVTKNSMQINIKLIAIGEDPINRALAAEIVRQLSAKYRFVADEPESGYDMTLFILHSDPSANPSIIAAIIQKLENIGSILAEGRLAIKNWTRGAIERYFSV